MPIIVRSIACWGLVVAGLSSCGAPPAYDRVGAEADIREIEHLWAQIAVTGDASVVERIFADDFLGVTPDGKQYTKREFIADTKANPLEFASNELNDVKVRFLGDVAVAQGDETFARKDGQQGRFVWTDVLVRRGGRWVIVAAQDVIAPASEVSNTGLFDMPPSTAGERSRSDSSVVRDRAAIDSVRIRYATTWKTGDAEQLAFLYTPDALVLYPNQPAVRGRAEIVTYFRGFFAEFAQEVFELTSEEIQVAGPWAFDRGTVRWRGVPRKGGEPVDDLGKYLVVLHRQPDGSWKVARDMDNSDRPHSQSTRGAG